MATLTGMNQGRQGWDEEVRQHSGWLIPLVVFVVTAGLSAMFLLFYLAPSPTSFIEQHTAPTTMTMPVALRVDGMNFVIPANYIMYRETRQGGERKDLALFAILPDFRGYSLAEAQAFSDQSADSPVVYILIREEHLNLPEAERIKRIYMSYVVDPQGASGPFGLSQYRFRDDSGYRDEDLFIGHMNGEPVAMRCWRFSADMPNPNCMRDRRLSRGVTLTYRFKRANLVQWREIADGVATLVSSFRNRAK